jgi:hypothetical protein
MLINMNKTLKQTVKSSMLALMAVISLITSSGRADAAESTFNKITCEKDGQAFFSSMISFTEFTETWKDVFVRYPKNTCYYADIANIAKQLETQRQNLRKAFYSCGSGIENLKKTYYELEAEIIYLRNFISISQSGIKAMADDRVKEKLIEYFVDDKQIYTGEEMTLLFDKFKQKYKDKVTKTYNECKDASIQMLIKKWDQLVKTIKSFGSNLEKLSEDFDKAINTPVERTGDFITSFLDIRESQLPARETPTQILTQLTEDAGGSAPTLEALQMTIQTKDEAYAQKAAEVSIAARYDALYKNGGDSMALDFVAKLKDLNTIIKDTYKPIESLSGCTKKTTERQCK